MYRHEHEHGASSDTLRPKAARLEEHDATLFRAAVAGRSDVVGRDGLLRLQRVVGNGAATGVATNPVLGVLSDGGQPLDAPVREDMEGRFGTGFGDVRVHTGDSAHASAKQVNAHAFTVGSDIVFQRDRYDPTSTAGRTMLAHELTHVVQQRSGPVDGTPTGGGFRMSDPSDRFEREAAANADRLVGSELSTLSPSASTVTPAAPGATSLQRAEDEEGEAVQGSFVDAPEVQRAPEDEETEG
jgi:hypothetical protein